jgi:DNA-binding transcriptional LysR family regulator
VLSGAEDAISLGLGDVVITSRVPPGFLGDWLLDVDFVAVARPDHALFRIERGLSTEDLVPHVQAVVRDSGTVRPRDEGWLGAERRFTVSSMEASLAIVLAGLAYAWLPLHLLIEPLRDGRLRRLPLTLGGSRTVALQIVAVHPNVLGPAAQAAVDAFHRHIPPLDLSP